MKVPVLDSLPRKWRIITVIALVVALAGAVTAIVVQRESGLPDGVALRVGDTNVTEQQVEHRMAVLEALYGIKAPKDERKADDFKRDSAKAVAVSIILDNAAKDRNIVIAEKTARDTLTKMIDTQLASGRAGFVELLRTYGASENDVIEEIKRQQSVDRLFQEVGVASAGKVTDAAVRTYYEENKDSLASPEQRSIQNIVVIGQKQARQLYQRARSGESFTALVRKYSLDESTKGTDGKLGRVEKSQLEDQYAELAFSTPVGGVFGPVKTRHGWNVGRVLVVHPAKLSPFEKVKDELRNTLRLQQAYETWRKWLAKEIKDADVEYADAYRPEDPDAPPPAPTTPSLTGGSDSTPGSSGTP
jgi:peptidyl-prolyl cis-trans isomerase C